MEIIEDVVDGAIGDVRIHQSRKDDKWVIEAWDGSTWHEWYAENIDAACVRARLARVVLFLERTKRMHRKRGESYRDYTDRVRTTAQRWCRRHPGKLRDAMIGYADRHDRDTTEVGGW